VEAVVLEKKPHKRNLSTSSTVYIYIYIPSFGKETTQKKPIYMYTYTFFSSSGKKTSQEKTICIYTYIFLHCNT